jgi:hypothetical protein
MSSVTLYLKAKGAGPDTGIKIKVNSTNFESWDKDPSTGNLVKTINTSGNPLKEWTIRSSENTLLDDDTLEDILILVKYKFSGS